MNLILLNVLLDTVIGKEFESTLALFPFVSIMRNCYLWVIYPFIEVSLNIHRNNNLVSEEMSK